MGQTILEKSNSETFNLEQSGNWYDLTIEFPDYGYSRRYMGRLETGVEGVTDPAFGRQQIEDEVHPETPEHLINQPGWWEVESACGSARSQFKGICKDSCSSKSFSNGEQFMKYLNQEYLFL